MTIIFATLLTVLFLNFTFALAAWRYHRARVVQLNRANRALETCLNNQQTYIDELQRRLMRVKHGQEAKPCRVLRASENPNYQKIDLLQSNASGTALVCRVWLN